MLALAFALSLFVVVELTVNSVCGAVEEIDRRPEQVRKVRFEPGVVQRGDQGVKNASNRARDYLTCWQRSRVWLVIEWTVSKELQFVEDRSTERAINLSKTLREVSGGNA